MSELSKGLRRVLAEIAGRRRSQGVMRLMQFVDEEGNMYGLDAVPLCPRCGADLRPDKDRQFLHCSGVHCMYGRRILA